MQQTQTTSRPSVSPNIIYKSHIKDQKLIQNTLPILTLPLRFRLIFAHCNFQLKKYETALEILAIQDIFELAVEEQQQQSQHDSQNLSVSQKTKLESSGQTNLISCDKENIPQSDTDRGEEHPSSENISNLGRRSHRLANKTSHRETKMLESETMQDSDPESEKLDSKTELAAIPQDFFKPSPKLLSKKYILISEIYDILQNPLSAFENLRLAISIDPFCATAWEKLKRKRYLSLLDQNNFLREWHTSLESAVTSFSKILQDKDAEIGSQNTAPTSKLTLSQYPKFENTSIYLLNLATDLFHQHKINKAYEITSRIIKINAFNWNALPLHLTILTELATKKSETELFKISHQLMDAAPDRSISWYAVGCYYYSINKLKPARQNLARATEFNHDPLINLNAWIAYGHSFAKDYEHDQALAAYIQAGQLMPYIHEPNLFIGMQHLSNKNYKLAEEYFIVAAEQSCQSNYVKTDSITGQETKTGLDSKFQDSETGIFVTPKLPNKTAVSFVNPDTSIFAKTPEISGFVNQLNKNYDLVDPFVLLENSDF